MGVVVAGAGGGAGGGAVCRRDGGGGGCATRTVSTVAATGGGGGAAAGGSLFFPSARYPPTPAATTTNAPTSIPTPDRFCFSAGIFIPARGMGVVGALVTSVGASAVALRGGGGRRGAFGVLPDFRGAATGCSGHTAVANSSIVGKRWSASLERERAIAEVRNSGESRRLPLARGTSSKMCL